MIEIGKMQKLEIIRETSVGVYLNQRDNTDLEDEDILLPRKQVPTESKIGQEIEVFVYRDSEDRKIATTQRPKLTLGEIGFLEVKQLTKIGAFLDYGLEKDLLLPFTEQKNKVKEGKRYLVGVYLDKSDRLCATMDIPKLLNSNSPYKQWDRVSGIIYNINIHLGAFVAVDSKYHGMIPQNELYGHYEVGDEVTAKVTKVKPDGKLDLTIREKSYKQMDKDAQIILDKLERNKGILYLNDKSDPNKIKKELDMSKGSFKKAVGRLLKAGEIAFIENGIKKL